jgi:replicative DNA helicase
MSKTLNTETIQSVITQHISSNRLLTGINEIDELTGGLQAGELIVIGGRPASGKTKIALKLMLLMGLRHAYHSVFYTLELNKEQVLQRILRERKLSLKSLQEANIHICDNSIISLEDIEQDIHKLNTISPVNLVVIDYIQLLAESASIEIWNKMKALAIRENLTLIILSSLKSSCSSDSPKHQPTEYLLNVTPESSAIDYTYLLP